VEHTCKYITQAVEASGLRERRRGRKKGRARGKKSENEKRERKVKIRRKNGCNEYFVVGKGNSVNFNKDSEGLQ
jgi:hypothetical protein